MNNRRLMIRLIDVALIILLGFIAISRLKTEYVDLPGPGEAQAQPAQEHVAQLRVYHGKYIIVDGRKKMRVAGREELQQALQRARRRYRRRGAKLVMNILPQKSSIMQDLIDVLDICERTQIEKNLDYDRIQ